MLGFVPFPNLRLKGDSWLVTPDLCSRKNSCLVESAIDGCWLIKLGW
jgi:hypothetical protein